MLSTTLKVIGLANFGLGLFFAWQQMFDLATYVTSAGVFFSVQAIHVR